MRSTVTEILYADRLVEITRETIKFRHYYFLFGAKTINIGGIEKVETLDPNLLSGKWRIHGTGDFRTWFPRDLQRPKRDRIFILFLRNRWRRIGFTVERSEEVRRLLMELGLINQKPAAVRTQDHSKTIQK